jgi:hypothetical protein
VNGSALPETTVPGAGFTVTFKGREDWPAEGTSMLMHNQTPQARQGSARPSKKGEKEKKKKKNGRSSC